MTTEGDTDGQKAKPRVVTPPDARWVLGLLDSVAGLLSILAVGALIFLALDAAIHVVAGRSVLIGRLR